MPQNLEHTHAHASNLGTSIARRSPSRPDAKARRLCLTGRSIVYLPEGDPLLTRARLNFVQLVDPAETTAIDLCLVDHPLPLAPGAVAQRGACTLAIGLSADNVQMIEPPPGHVALPLVTYLPTGPHRPTEPASAAQWRECGCFDVQLAPDELLCEALGHLGIDRSGSGGDAERRRLDARLQSDAEAAGQLFARWPWLHLIKHRLQLRGLDVPTQVATVPAALASRAYSEIYGTDLQVPYARGSAGALDWRH